MTRQSKTSAGAAETIVTSHRFPVHRLLLAFMLLVALAVPANAFAVTTRDYESSFGAFSNGPDSLAIDQSNGDIYAIAGNQVQRFDANGTPKDFTAGPDAGTNALTGFSFTGQGDIAIDNSGGSLSGSIYVADHDHSTVKIFSNAGAGLGTLTGSGSKDGNFNRPCGVAVDQSNGDVYIAYTASTLDSIHGRIWRYVPTSPAAPIDDVDYSVTGIRAGRICDLAVDAGNVYAHETFLDELRKHSASEFGVNVPSSSPDTLATDVTAVTVDPGNGDIYVNNGDRVSVFDANGELLYRFGFPAYFGSFGGNSSGIAVKSAASGPASKAYVADSHSPGGNQIDVFGLPANAPSLTHLELGSFGKDGTSEAPFTHVNQLTFDQATRKLYGLDTGSLGIDEGSPGVFGFDASSPPSYPTLGGFTPLATALVGERPGLAVDSTALGSTGNLYLASQSTDLLYGFDSTGTALGGSFPIDSATTPGPPDGSPKDLCGTAVDSAGSVWVANASTKRILKYSSAGAPLPGAIDTSAQGSPCRLAFDSSDDLYVAIGISVWKFTAASSYTTAIPIDGDSLVQGIAVDPSTDHLYVAHPDRVDEWDSAGNFVTEFATNLSSIRGIAVDATNHYVYLANQGTKEIHVFGPGVFLPETSTAPASSVTNTTATLNGTVGAQGLPLTDCRFEYVAETAFNLTGFSDLGSGGTVPCNPPFASIPVDFELYPVSANVSGLSSNTTYRFRLVAANATAADSTPAAAFTTPGSPGIETVGAPVRTTTTAQLNGRVNPRGAATTFHFEYGEAGPCDTSSCASTAPQPAGSGSLIELVAEEITGLEPATTYHYRLVADNGNPDGPAFGEDMTVTTRASDAPLGHGHFPGPPGSDRAYELVSLSDSSGNPVFSTKAMSDQGDRVAYELTGGSPISETGKALNPFLAERTAKGWHSQLLSPSRSELINPAWNTRLVTTSDLSTLLSINGDSSSETLWRFNSGVQPLDFLSVALPQEFPTGWHAASDDASRVVALLSGGQLDPDYPAVTMQSIYDISSGAPELASLFPGEAVPACGVSGSLVEKETAHSLSADGSHLFFPSQGDGPCGGNESNTQLYVRDLEADQTALISGAPISGPDCVDLFIRSTVDAAFFWTQSRLSSSDTAPDSCASTGSPPDGDVYRYDVASGISECVTCVLPGRDADVSVLISIKESAANQILIPDDGSRVYFRSSATLLPGTVTEGAYRVNVSNDEIAYVGFVNPGGPIGDAGNQGDGISHDGSVILFRSDRPNLNPRGGTTDNGGTTQLYRYDDRDRSLVCVSCPSDGSVPVGAFTFAGGTISLDGDGRNLNRLSSDGETLAFVTPSPLVFADQNTSEAGKNLAAGSDVYEWRDGRFLLVTDGLTRWSVFEGIGQPQVAGISPSGRDLFFIAAAQYTPDALDAYSRIYDARIGGGIDFPKPPPPCPLEVCQGIPNGVPDEQAPATPGFRGTGNLVEPPPTNRCRKGQRKVRRAGKVRCVKKTRNRAGKRTNRQGRANDNRRAVR